MDLLSGIFIEYSPFKSVIVEIRLPFTSKLTPGKPFPLASVIFPETGILFG